MTYQPLRLRANAHKRLTAGHCWIYSNEVDTQTTPLKALSPGTLVTVEKANGQALGVAYANPQSLICARLLSRDSTVKISTGWLRQRLQEALALRQHYYDQPYYRWVFSEADALPGLILDRYGEYCVGQINTAGMASLQPQLEEALQGLDGVSGLLWRNDSPIRELEGLERQVVDGFGEVPQRLQLQEAGLKFDIDPRQGQKTGWFYDQRHNRDALATWWADARVLDLFSYVGGWALRAAAAGAREVTAVDRSAPAIELLEHNAGQNGLTERILTHCGPVDEYLGQAREQRERFDVVVLDPPALVKKSRDKGAGLAAYRKLKTP